MCSPSHLFLFFCVTSTRFRELPTKACMYTQWLLLHPHALWLWGKGNEKELFKRKKQLVKSFFFFYVLHSLYITIKILSVDYVTDRVVEWLTRVSQTQLMYKWIQPKICSETIEWAVKLPASGEKQSCPPCNPGFFVNSTSACEPCSNDSYSNGTGTESLLFVSSVHLSVWSALLWNKQTQVFFYYGAPNIKSHQSKYW